MVKQLTCVAFFNTHTLVHTHNSLGYTTLSVLTCCDSPEERQFHPIHSLNRHVSPTIPGLLLLSA